MWVYTPKCLLVVLVSRLYEYSCASQFCASVVCGGGGGRLGVMSTAARPDYPVLRSCTIVVVYPT